MLGSIWTIERRLWPQAASRYVFLAAAFDEVGRALFPEWTGDEAKAVAEDAPEGDGAAKRRLAVVEIIGNHGRNSTFQTFGLAAPGGTDLVPLGAGVWNRANDWELFANCTVHRVFVPRVLEADYHIFLNRDGLSRTIELERHCRKMEANPQLALERRVTRAPDPPQHRVRGIGWRASPVSTIEEKPRSGGRRKGTGGYAAGDEAVARKIKALRDAGDTRAPMSIARDFESEIEGSKVEDNHLRRVARVFWRMYPDK